MICWPAALYTTILSVNLDTCILNGPLVYLPSIWLTVMSNVLERVKTCWMCRKPIFCLRILWIFKYIDCTLSHFFQFYKTEWHHICSADVHWNIVVLMCVYVLELSVITLLENFFYSYSRYLAVAYILIHNMSINVIGLYSLYLDKSYINLCIVDVKRWFLCVCRI